MVIADRWLFITEVLRLLAVDQAASRINAITWTHCGVAEANIDNRRRTWALDWVRYTGGVRLYAVDCLVTDRHLLARDTPILWTAVDLFLVGATGGRRKTCAFRRLLRRAPIVLVDDAACGADERGHREERRFECVSGVVFRERGDHGGILEGDLRCRNGL